MTLELKASCISKELRNEISHIFRRKEKDAKLTGLEDMFWFVIEEMPDCKKED